MTPPPPDHLTKVVHTRDLGWSWGGGGGLQGRPGRGGGVHNSGKAQGQVVWDGQG